MTFAYKGLAAAALLLAASSSAFAISAISTDAVTLRAGPGTEFPEVTTVPANDPVEVFGCIDAYAWCDVSYGGLRGWISGNDLAYLEGGERVVFVEAAPRISVPIVSFSIGTYWDEYYRDRPFYVERERYGGPAVEVNIDARDRDDRKDDGAADAPKADAAPATDAPKADAAPAATTTDAAAPAEAAPAAAEAAPAPAGDTTPGDAGAATTGTGEAGSDPALLKKPKS